jgi:hypothetical protein
VYVPQEDGHLRPTGKSVAKQATEFIHETNVWPVAQSLTVTPTPGRDDGSVTYVLTLTWMPVRAWFSLQSMLTANAQRMKDQLDHDDLELDDEQA